MAVIKRRSPLKYTIKKEHVPFLYEIISSSFTVVLPKKIFETRQLNYPNSLPYDSDKEENLRVENTVQSNYHPQEKMADKDSGVEHKLQVSNSSSPQNLYSNNKADESNILLRQSHEDSRCLNNASQPNLETMVSHERKSKMSSQIPLIPDKLSSTEEPTTDSDYWLTLISFGRLTPVFSWYTYRSSVAYNFKEFCESSTHESSKARNVFSKKHNMLLIVLVITIIIFIGMRLFNLI